jgi:hypothetical protein
MSQSIKKPNKLPSMVKKPYRFSCGFDHDKDDDHYRNRFAKKPLGFICNHDHDEDAEENEYWLKRARSGRSRFR